MISKNQMKLIRSLEMKKNRRSEQLFVAEGPKVVGDLLQAGFLPHSIFSTTAWPGSQQITEEELRRISFLQHPQEVLAVFHMPAATDSVPLPTSLALALDGVQDPGNVGTVLRTLDAFDGDGLLLLPGCADPFSPKTVRASMGAVFRRPVWTVTVQELSALAEKSGLPLYGAALRSDTVDAREVDLRRCIMAIGSEGRGLSDAVLALCRPTVRIPMSPRCESLNAAVAASVLLWEGYR